MLEIIALVYLCAKLGKIMKDKGRNPLLIQISAVVSWFVAMFIAAVCFGFYQASALPNDAPYEPGFMIYPVMLVGAALSQVALFKIANNLSPKNPPIA
jgi:hypothetical protein